MPGYKDWVNLAVLTESDLDDFVGKQVVMKLASVAARTAALTGFFREGLMTYLDDLNTLGVNTGAADTWSSIGPVHGVLTQFTPTLTQSTTVTKTTAHSSYSQVGRRTTGTVTLTATGAGTAANAVVVGLPVAAAANQLAIGAGYITDLSTGTLYGATLNMASSTTANFVGDSATGALGVAKFTAALAAGDTITYQFCYEAAAD